MSARPFTAQGSLRPSHGLARPTSAQGTQESLRLRLRTVDTNNKSWQEQVQKDLRRQKLELESLRRENETLKQQLNEQRATEATSSTASVGGSSTSRRQHRHKELEAKRDSLLHLEMRLQNELAHAKSLEERIEQSRTQVATARRGMGGVNVSADTHAMVDRQVSILENRLDQSLVLFNEALRQNKELREQIDTLRGERDVFDAIYQKLESELQEKKKEMAFIIEVSNIAYEERDNNLQVLNNLKTFAAEEMKSFTETFRELDELLEEDRRMKEQVRTRIAALQRKQTFSDEEDNNMRAPGWRPKKTNVTGAAASSAKSGTGLASPTAREGMDAEDVGARVQAYEEAFFRIKQATDIPDLQVLVQRFLHSEEDNFALFAYMNDLTREIEALEKGKGELYAEAAKLTVGDDNDQQRRTVLRSLEERLRHEEHRNEKLFESTQRVEGVLRAVISVVGDLFVRLDCDDSTIIAQHGISGLTSESLLLYLAAIELRAEEYLTGWAKQSGALTEFAGPRGPQVPYDSAQVTVDAKRLPGTGEDAEGSDDDDHPLTREELLRKAQRKLQALHQSAPERGGRPVRPGRKPMNPLGGKK